LSADKHAASEQIESLAPKLLQIDSNAGSTPSIGCAVADDLAAGNQEKFDLTPRHRPEDVDALAAGAHLLGQVGRHDRRYERIFDLNFWGPRRNTGAGVLPGPNTLVAVQ